jgi:hypothetical protein
MFRRISFEETYLEKNLERIMLFYFGQLQTMLQHYLKNLENIIF